MLQAFGRYTALLLLILSACSINNRAVKLKCYGPFELKHLQEPDAPPPPRVNR